MCEFSGMKMQQKKKRIIITIVGILYHTNNTVFMKNLLFLQQMIPLCWLLTAHQLITSNKKTQQDT